MELFDFNTQQMLNYFNRQPSVVKGQINSATEYYKRYLYNLIYSVFDFTLPKEWAINYFRYWLFHCGSIACIYTNEYGWIVNPYSIVKLNLYHQPNIIQVTNQFLNKTKIGKIGDNAEIIKCFDDYYGFHDIVTTYAEKLADCDKSIKVSLLNSNVAFMAEVENKKQGDEIKEAYGTATEGNPFVVINKNVLGNNGQLKTMIDNPKSIFIAPDIMTVKRQIVNEFLTTVGIRNANYDKKERLNSQEVSENDDQTRALVEIVYDNIKSSFDRLNAISDLNLAVKLRYSYKTEVKEGEEEWTD